MHILMQKNIPHIKRKPWVRIDKSRDFTHHFIVAQPIICTQKIQVVSRCIPNALVHSIVNTIVRFTLKHADFVTMLI